MKKGNGGAFLAGMLVGGAIGTIAGLLIAPRSGKETRRILKKSADALPELAEDLSTSVQLQADRLSESAMRNWNETLDRLKEAIAAGIEASQIEAQERQQPRQVTVDTNSSENHHL
ncbi:gas vesicle protein [Hydrococcus rivularis NIES-593]|uniref:Gas vesicle protein n=1 Tax=Hydrococcus rivularis NIES-593 TaxID=1921803 RepID=A0A1U7HKS7_9CYAN|nr:YtxH domain-containing protein [Hydrococcus rivularis]OKH24192.1 gas vesicle protein [Hydrococcus rivularis NIES-593]